MAFCAHCGNELSQGSAFCGKCGSPVAGGANPYTAPQAQAAPQQTAAPQSTAAPQQTAAMPTSAPAPQAAPQEKGIFGKAWADFANSPSKFMIVLKLALFQFLPGVGNLALNGYVLSWGKERALGKSNPMPQKLIRPGVLDSGLYAYGVQLIFGAALFLLTMILNMALAPFGLGWLAGLTLLAFGVFYGPFCYLAYFRAALCGKVRSGLNLSAVWKLFTAPGKMGKFMGSFWAINAIAGVIIFLLFAIFFSVAIAAGTMSAGSLSYLGASSYYSYAPLMAAYSIIGAMLAMIPLALVLGFAAFLVNTIAFALVIRAYGYAIEDMHPENWDEYQEAKRHYDQAC